jgi:hypothetical protein
MLSNLNRVGKHYYEHGVVYDEAPAAAPAPESESESESETELVQDLHLD